MWLKLYRNDFLRVSDQLNRCIESTPALFGNDRKQLQLFYARRGEIAWPNVSHHSLSSKLQSSLDMCRFRMRSCMENCAISRLKIDEKIPSIFQKIFHPHRNEEKNEWYDTDFSKNKRDYIIKNTKVFYYVQSLVDVVATARSNDAKCSVAFLENKRRKISWEDNWFQRLLFVCLFVYDCMESASWARRANWLD